MLSYRPKYDSNEDSQFDGEGARGLEHHSEVCGAGEGKLSDQDAFDNVLEGMLLFYCDSCCHTLG